MGCLMKSAIAMPSLSDEHFVLQMDGQVKSQHRRFVDAVIAGLFSDISFRSTTSKCERRKRALARMRLFGELLCTDFGSISVAKFFPTSRRMHLRPQLSWVFLLKISHYILA